MALLNIFSEARQVASEKKRARPKGWLEPTDLFGRIRKHKRVLLRTVVTSVVVWVLFGHVVAAAPPRLNVVLDRTIKEAEDEPYGVLQHTLFTKLGPRSLPQTSAPSPLALLQGNKETAHNLEVKYAPNVATADGPRGVTAAQEMPQTAPPRLTQNAAPAEKPQSILGTFAANTAGAAAQAENKDRGQRMDAKTSYKATKDAVEPWPHIYFGNHPGSLGKKVVSLTFDDGPDGRATEKNNTARVLDILKARNIKASFFVCSYLLTDVTFDQSAQSDLRRIVAEGHDIGSHTATHPHLDTIATKEIDAQFFINQMTMRRILGDTFSFNKYRVPFGTPFQNQNPNAAWVAPITAKYGIHVGWGIDTNDWKCAEHKKGSACIMDNLKAQVDAGATGPVLMHSVYDLTSDTLPQVIDYLQEQGFTFVTAEQMIQDKYGMTSENYMSAWRAEAYSPAQISAAAISACEQNLPIRVPF